MQGMGKGGRKAEFNRSKGNIGEPGRLFLRGREEQEQGLPETGGLPRQPGPWETSSQPLTHTI